MIFQRKTPEIYTLFLKHAQLIFDSAELLLAYSQPETIGQNNLNKITKLEQAGDELVKEIGLQIEQNFVLPMDKEDLKRWSEAQDDVLDALEKIVLRIEATNYDHPEYVQNINQLIYDGSEAILIANQQIAKGGMNSIEYDKAYKELQLVEREGDKYHQKSLKKIFKMVEVMEVLKGKEVFEILEECLNRFEKMSVLFETFKYKYE